MRVYLPVTLDELQGADPVLIGPRVAHAVTPALRALWPEEDDEGWEYAAQADAGDGSLVLLASRRAAPPLRVVVAADVAEACVQTLDDPPVASAVEVVCGVDLGQVVSVHVDEPAAAADVAGAASGDETALARLDERDLLWYDVTEIGQIPAP
ncbi:DUF6912 family protein [Cellulomonas wangsupingiae]|uniref:Uncharacterized protein n=1 Tax=Cellulomonas wangsupingiae TaxID=2968085 RepID=A0ABY5K255_9CELL|nr:hypothetical protein [Cellulomonas wangsupingiae]MCC2335636.1 hypothetical protein [Cellulomonas wangsupingiae]MCM0640267.1 hypothetical protein [Cellulomonas wangsupingiae]UUI63873.1 hypothetical protein NP075_12100 [Cellulomonas wangsupingiae]